AAAAGRRRGGTSGSRDVRGVPDLGKDGPGGAVAIAVGRAVPTLRARGNLNMGKPDGTLSDDCPLDRGTQTRNLLLFAACFGANYLAAPVGYIGVLQASLCKRLGAGETVANLPLSIYLGTTAFTVLVAWWFPLV